MSSEHGLIPFANHVINRFLHWRQGDEDETWKNRAFLTLEKKLKKKNDGSFELFFKVVLEKKSPNTPCVTLDRSQDGRLQVSHRKMLPHVMCCRIARWPDLQTHQELKSVDHCKYPGHQKLPKVCINPFHYLRVDHPVYPPVLTPRVTGGFANSPSISPPASSSYSALPIDYYSQAASMSPQSFNGQQTPYGSAVSPGSQSFESQTPPPGYHDAEMDLDNRYLPSPNNISDNPFNRNSDIWCKITYWELSSHVGKPFTASSPTVTIDGFIDPSNNNQRFSLGSLSNINRNSVIEATRRAIGSGVRIDRNGAEIWVKNLSEKPVFFQSRNCNIAQSMQSDNVYEPQDVIRMPPDCCLKIFDFKIFEELVRGAMGSTESKYESVSSLNSHCFIKMSFVKGWGPRYQRQEVTSTPCWLDITLYEPLAYLDTKLRELGCSKGHITSTS